MRHLLTQSNLTNDAAILTVTVIGLSVCKSAIQVTECHVLIVKTWQYALIIMYPPNSPPNSCQFTAFHCSQKHQQLFYGYMMRRSACCCKSTVHSCFQIILKRWNKCTRYTKIYTLHHFRRDFNKTVSNIINSQHITPCDSSWLMYRWLDTMTRRMTYSTRAAAAAAAAGVTSHVT